MKTFHIIVANKVATYLQRDGYIVCGNSDNQIEFTFDDEWKAYNTKTVRFIWNGKYKDVKVTGSNIFKVPVVDNTEKVTVGVYVEGENMSTTTPATIPCQRSILCGSNLIPEGTVVVPEGTPVLVEKTFNANGEYPATNYGADGFSKVKINVPTEIPEGYIKPTGTKAITENGPHDVAKFASVEVNVPTGSGEAPNLGGITVTATEDYQNILATDKGLDGFDEVIVEPIPDEYVIPSGTLDITENGIRSLAKPEEEGGGYYGSINVNVPTSSEPTLITPEPITENGTYNANDFNADGFASVTVNVESSGGGAELNIAYGDTAPEDTSKLWVKTTHPSAVKVSSEIPHPEEQVSLLSATLTTNVPHPGCARKGNKVYLFYKLKISCFDIETETISTLSTALPANLEHLPAEIVGTKIYLFGGKKGSVGKAEIYCFDTETETISTLSTVLPSARAGITSATYGTDIFLFGGATISGGNSTEALNSILLFDTQTETITTLNITLPEGGAMFATVMEGNNKLHLLGGYSVGYSVRGKHYCFELDTRKITELTENGNLERSGAATALFDGVTYLIGGTQGDNHIRRYNLITDTIEELSLTHCFGTTDGRYRRAVTDGDTVYIFGGASAEICRLDIPQEVSLSANNLQIVSGLTANTFNIINTDTAQVEIGVNKVYKGNADGIGEEVEASLHNGTSWVTI